MTDSPLFKDYDEKKEADEAILNLILTFPRMMILHALTMNHLHREF